MVAKSKFKSDVSEAMHATASALHKVGALDPQTMQAFDLRHLNARSMTRRRRTNGLKKSAL
jgi:putative transcriptional regulator